MAVGPTPEIGSGDIVIVKTSEGISGSLIGTKEGITVRADAMEVGPFSSPHKFAARLEIADIENLIGSSGSVVTALIDKYDLTLSTDPNSYATHDHDSARTMTDIESPWRAAHGWQVVDAESDQQTDLIARISAANTSVDLTAQAELLTMIQVFETRYPQHAAELRTKLAMSNPRRDGELYLTEVQVSRTNNEPIPTDQELEIIHQIVATMLGPTVMSNFILRVVQQAVDTDSWDPIKQGEYRFDVLMRRGMQADEATK